MKSRKEDSKNHCVRVNLKRDIILGTWKHLDMRKCGDEEDTAAIVRGATSRALWELPRFWRLETRHQEALTGITATWGWEATAQIAVSKQTSSFICCDLRSGISHKKKTIFVSLPFYASFLRYVWSIAIFDSTISCADFMTNTRRIFLKFSFDFVERGKYYGECDLIVMVLTLANRSLDCFI